MKSLIKPTALQQGDTIAAITLSWGAAGTFPARYEVGRQRLESIFGLKVVPTRHALRDSHWIVQNPKARADDWMEAFADPNIRGIFSMIGGEDTIRIEPYIDYNCIQENPKIFMGFSDTTVNHFMCLKAGLGSFYGPSVLTGFSENAAMHNYTRQGVEKTLFSNAPLGDLPKNTEGWTHEFLDWAIPANQNIRRALQPTTPWRFINESDPAEGRLIGGCLDTLLCIQDTELWPSLDTWAGTILFLETSEHGMSPAALAGALMQFAKQGILSKIKGILFSKPGGPKIRPEDFILYDHAIVQVLREHGLANLPIVTNMDFGHTDPFWPLPYGCMVRIDGTTETVSLLESGLDCASHG